MANTIIEVDLSTGSVESSPAPEAYRHLGGRALTSTIVGREVEPACHPLGAGNVLVFAPGLLAGTALSSANRLSAGAKSPLTGGIKEANSGGTAALKLGRLGIKAVVLRGERRPGQGLLGLRIASQGASLLDLGFLRGQGAYAAARSLRERFGERTALILIGPAGEMRLPAACIDVTDPEGEPCRNLGRGGLGAVMGAKGVKAIVIDDAGATSPAAGDPAVKAAVRRFAAALKAHPVTGEKFARYGTCMTLLAVNALEALPTRNFSRGVFEQAERIGGEALYRTISSRGGLYAHGCMPGCVIRCSNKYVDAGGRPVVGSLDYETICLLGSNIGLADLDQIAQLNRRCNDLGIDTMETGAALGVLAEGGVLPFGDFEKARALVEEVGRGTPLGRLVGCGCVACGKAYGVRRVPAVKGQGMAAYDPRAVKGMGLTYALSPMGADHTAGNAIVLAVDHSDPAVQLEPVRELNVQTMVLDSLGLCIFTARVSLDRTELVEEALAAVTGRRAGWEQLLQQARQSLLVEREFNRRAGFTRAHDRLPEYMRSEKLPPGGAVNDISLEDFDRFYDFQDGGESPGAESPGAESPGR